MLNNLISLGLVLGVLGLGAYNWHEQTVRETSRVCNLEWGRKLQSANAVATQELEKAQSRMDGLQAELEARNQKFEEKINEYEAKLEQQKIAHPLSDACAQCRIPGERLRTIPAGNSDRNRDKNRPAQTN